MMDDLVEDHSGHQRPLLKSLVDVEAQQGMKACDAIEGGPAPASIRLKEGKA